MSSLSKLIRFARDVQAEASRITWPSFADTRQMSIMVAILATIVAIYLVVVDFAIGAALKAILGF